MIESEAGYRQISVLHCCDQFRTAVCEVCSVYAVINTVQNVPRCVFVCSHVVYNSIYVEI